MVSDQPLATVKDHVKAEVRKKYLSTEATVTLLRPRPIVVSVSGYVLNGGLYTLSAIDRANRAINEANKPSRFQDDDQVKPILRDMSTRNVVLRHRDGTQDRVDVTKFFATKEERWNPYLREGDVIIVPRRNFLKNVFGIYGEVNAPSRYEYVEGDSIKDMIRLAQGFTTIAHRDSAVFSRLAVTVAVAGVWSSATSSTTASASTSADAATAATPATAPATAAATAAVIATSSAIGLHAV